MSAVQSLNQSDESSSPITAESDRLRRQFSRTPRPYSYSHDGLERQDGETGGLQPGAGASDGLPEQERPFGQKSSAKAGRTEQAGHSSVASSESGTDADDERPDFVKALPPAGLRPRKGLKTGEQDEDALLTPSQLDEKERQVRGYFLRQTVDAEASKGEEQKEREAVQKRRFAEFARRTSEVTLMGFILICVLCGDGTARLAWTWRRELLCMPLIIIGLVAAYPVKLSIVDTQATHNKLSERFRVPASFDPATVLYPPLLPVMVALLVGPTYPAVILPNIILGLASLPQRLFPRSSRLGGFNALHWLVTIIPLIVAENTAFSNKWHPLPPHQLKMPRGLSPETLVSLYPLHHALMIPLHYLTTTSLLISELHLLSAALINLLLLAQSPQAMVLKSCLWVGSIPLFLACGPLLHWNVTLARVPRWKLRRPGHTAEERKSLVDAVSDVISLQRATGAFARSTRLESDADEDLQPTSIKQQLKRSMSTTPKLNTADLVMPSLKLNVLDTHSVAEAREFAHSLLPGIMSAPPARQRRNTVPIREPPLISGRQPEQTPVRRASSKRKTRAVNVLWCLQLTPEQAQRRKWLYAVAAYGVIFLTIAVPVRLYIARNALHGQEPIGWALSYAFGHIDYFRFWIENLYFESWVPLPRPMGDWANIVLSLPFQVDHIREILGQANVRLLVIVYWAAVLLAGLLAVFSLTAFVEVDTRRKVFHGVMVAMLTPATFVDPCFVALALGLVLAVFLLLEVIRAGQVPPLGNAISRFVAPYVDGRDLRGPVVVSHIFLLIGCAVPLWFSLASMERSGDAPWHDFELANNRREVAMVAGVICVGMGDAAASLIGRRYGRHKWIWVGGKSIEGSAAFAAAVTVGLMAARAWQQLGGWNGLSYDRIALGWVPFAFDWTLALGKSVLCGCAASFMEAVLTGANDNVVVPVALWLLVKGVRI
ncbi:hypothetical protein DOTSEDRAFT_75018 [Dothistroma septosporum NZE10]|uniref:dolichol kinase n=1 Tax=Dothistroma septosporum (strain NZE10 / CBS 128990) TaxID=675120 RepID=M2XI21_DOTSN|nr:hypothetical protein DOTSEDRAFT_75018 [Dothistroma septosporum NZE10]